MSRLRIDEAHRFSLYYLRDNGRLHGWETVEEPRCVLVRRAEGDGYGISVLNADDEVIGWGEDEEGALLDAQVTLTNLRRIADGVTPARVC